MSRPATVITNAGPLIALGKLNRLRLLVDLYGVVRTPADVYDEVVQKGLQRGEPDASAVRRFWRQQRWPIDQVTSAAIDAVPARSQLGRGERAVFALASQMSQALLLIDDAIARSEARRMGFQAHGTLGILVRAYRQELIGFNETELLIEELADRVDIWINPALCRRVLDELRGANYA